MFCRIKISLNSKEILTSALIDTGNMLHEPITKTPVVVIEKKVLEDIIPKYILNNLNKIITGEDIELNEYASKIRIIPFTSLGKENGILVGIKANYAIILMEENSIYEKNIIIGIYDGILSKTGKYHGLIGIDSLEENNTKELVLN